MSKVSVIIPCYRYGKHVKACVASLLSNTEVSLDILVIDDASPDGSWSVVEKLPEIDPRIRVRQNTVNRGLIDTANEAIEQAGGDYVVLLSADDALAPGWLDRSVSLLDGNPQAVLAYGPTRRFTGQVPSLHLKRSLRPVVYHGRDWIEETCVRGVTPTLSPEVVVRTSAQHKVGGYRPELPFSSDMEMWLRLASVGDVVRADGPVAAFYRVSAESMSRSIYSNPLKELEIRRDAFEQWHEYCEGLVPNDTSLLAKARNSLARSAVRRAYSAFFQDPPPGTQFDGLCDFALSNDPMWAGPHVERLTTLRERRWINSLRDRAQPAARISMRARQGVTDVRARLHVI